MTITTLAAVLAAFFVLPIVVLFWATESPQQRARRMRRRSHTFGAMAGRMNVTPHTAHRHFPA